MTNALPADVDEIGFAGNSNEVFNAGRSGVGSHAARAHPCRDRTGSRNNPVNGVGAAVVFIRHRRPPLPAEFPKVVGLGTLAAAPLF
jgi:hypothetical protein